MTIDPHLRSRAALLCLSLFLLAGEASGAAALKDAALLQGLHAPLGFTIEPIAGEPLIRFPMFACFDDEGRLFVAESSGNDLYAGLKRLSRDCRISRLEDTNGDGRFDRAVVFQENVTFPMGLAWSEGKLFLADPPDLVALADTDGDGRADKREVILSGFGHTDNGSLHGLAFGPDGLLYFTMGEPDGWKLPRGDGTFLEGRNGALFRCRPDGSHLEVICRGFENLVEIEFMPGGEIIGTDNWYQRPAGGYRDALIDCAPGGLYPYAPDLGTPLPRTGLKLPPLTLLPAVAHSGLTRLRGTGFPIEWRDSLFVAQHNTRKIVRHELRREGSTFASTNIDFITGDAPDFHPADVLEDADGSLLVVDTGGWYVEHCPTGRIRDSRAPGGIYRVRWNRAPQVTDPRGRLLPWTAASAAELTERLRDPRPVVADRAAMELAQRRQAGALAAALEPSEKNETRLRALWALARLRSDEALPALRSQLAAAEPELVCAAARALAFREDKASGDALAALLASPNAPIRRAAAEALAVCGSRSLSPRIAAALAAARAAFEDHTCVIALLALADEPFARGLLRHDAPRVRRAGLQLIDQPPFATLRFADLAAPLRASDSALRATARELLERHGDWAAQALPWLREQLAAPADDRGDAALGDVLVAFQAQPKVRRLISDLLDPTAGTAASTRAFLLNLLPLLATQPPEESWMHAVQSALTNVALRPAALNAASANPRAEFAPTLARLAEDASLPAAQRLLAARAAPGRQELSEGVLALALGALDAKASAVDRLGAVDLLVRSRLSADQLPRLLAALQRAGAAMPDTLLPTLTREPNDRTRPVLADFFRARLQSGWAPGRATFDVALHAFPQDSPARASLLAAWEQNNAQALSRLNEFRPLLNGGDMERGRELFATATCAGCHRIGARGGTVGPDLSKIGAIRSGGDLLESILFPSRSFAQGYEPYLLTRRDGEEIFGSLVAEGPEGVSLRGATGEIHRVRPGDIASLVRQEASVMPEGLEQLMTREQFRDLLAYLQSLR